MFSSNIIYIFLTYFFHSVAVVVAMEKTVKCLVVVNVNRMFSRPKRFSTNERLYRN